MSKTLGPVKKTPFLDLVERRVSCRKYKHDPVPSELVEQILEAARLAPSACNNQPWRFVVVTDNDRRERLATDGILPGLGMDWIADAPVVLVIGIHRSVITHRVAPKVSGVDYALMDLGIAGEHAVLQATELGLGTCWIGWINPRAIRRIIEWPRDIMPQALITVGWPDEAAISPRPRMGKDEISKWL
jgi:nitroreductase